ncbi:DNA primase [Patescibacteria group bacterium]
MDERDQIKDRIDIVELINDYVPLKKAGANFRAPCPLHQEKTPSFMVSPTKQIWHCFGCGKGGDVFTWLMEKESMEFPEALRTLAKRAGVELKPRNPKIWTQKNKLYEINNLAARYFHEAFKQSREGEIARGYMSKRKFTDDILEQFLVGYSPDSWEILNRWLRKKGYSAEVILAAGLTVKKDQGGHYDRFRGRLMFPIKNTHGDVVAFGARQLQEKTGAKYINTPETDIYHKSWVMYGLDNARGEIRQQDLAVVVEGYTDVLASHQVGIKNVVASSGTALTEGHLELLKRYTSNLALAFDMDLAGDMATKRGIELALARGFDIKIIKLPAGQDPADVALRSKESWQQAINQRQPIMEFFFADVLAGRDLKKVGDKKVVVKELLPIIKRIESEVERHHYLHDLASRLQVPEEALLASLQKTDSFGDQRQNKTTKPAAKDIASKPGEVLEKRFLGLLLKQPQEMEYTLDHFDTDYLENRRLRTLYSQLEKLYNTNRSFTAEEFTKYLQIAERDLATEVLKLLLCIEKDFDGADVEILGEELKACIFLLQKKYIKKRLQGLSDEIARAESVKDTNVIEELSSEFTRLTNQLRETEQQISRR